MNIDHEIIIQNQIDALHNNQVTFILYETGAGGEFLLWLISKYSSNNYFEPIRQKEDNNRSFIITNFLCRYFLERMPDAGGKFGMGSEIGVGLSHKPIHVITESDICVKHKFITAERILFEQQNILPWCTRVFKEGKMLELDTHLNNKGRIIIPAHLLFTKYMNRYNTFLIKRDKFKHKHYIKDLSFIKITKHFKHFTFEEAAKFATPILMSQMYNKGYLEEMFNIEGDEFHKELISWHRENVRLVNEYRKRKNYEEKGISIPTL